MLHSRLLIAALFLCACGDFSSDIDGPTNQLETAIIDGEASPQGSYPNVGAILLVQETQWGPFAGVQCTGTLIAPDVVLTAAHCVDEELTSRFGGQSTLYFTFEPELSTFGQSQTVTLPANTYEVGQTVQHLAFDLDSFNPSSVGGDAGQDFVLGVDQEFFDVALMFLNEAVTDRAPATLMRERDELNVGDIVNIIGYGQRAQAQSFFDQVPSGVKFEAETLINEIGGTEMQIGSVAPTPQKCHGDSGGPTFKKFYDGARPIERLVGVTSHAYDSADCLKGGVDTRVDAYWNWVRTEMEKACDGVQRPLCEGGKSSLLTVYDAPSVLAQRLENGLDADLFEKVQKRDQAFAEFEAGTIQGETGCSQQGSTWMSLGALLLFVRRRRRG